LPLKTYRKFFYFSEMRYKQGDEKVAERKWQRKDRRRNGISPRSKVQYPPGTEDESPIIQSQSK
jgi:hypothetical protein